MIRDFLTWRLNFYRFKWYRKAFGYPDPRPLSNAEFRAMLDKMVATLDFSASVNRDYDDAWTTPHKDRYL